MKFETKEMQTKGIKMYLINENDEEIARCFIYLIYNDLHDKPYALLEDVFVKEEYRGKGIGSKIVEEAIRIAKNLGCYKVLATSRFQREEVHKFYEKLGFKKWGYEFRIDL